MELIEKYKEQHSEMLAIIKELKKILHHDPVSKIGRIKQKISSLAEKLKVHNAFENKYLYPKMLKNKNDTIKQTTIYFINEMRELNNALNDCLDKWTGSDIINKNQDEYIAYTLDKLTALGCRIMEQETDFFTMVDRLPIKI